MTDSTKTTFTEALTLIEFARDTPFALATQHLTTGRSDDAIEALDYLQAAAGSLRTAAHEAARTVAGDIIRRRFPTARTLEIVPLDDDFYGFDPHKIRDNTGAILWSAGDDAESALDDTQWVRAINTLCAALANDDNTGVATQPDAEAIRQLHLNN